MPDWTAPFHLPKLTDDEYSRQKDAYVAKNGYTITIPGLSDIIKIRTEDPMTKLESYWWNEKQYDKFGPQRLEEIRRQKKKRLDRYTAMLASPTPAIVSSAGSIMTAIDDAQDAISTLAVLGRIGIRVAPKAIAKFLEGPVGLVMTASDILNLIQSVPQSCMSPLMGKRTKDTMTRASPKQIFNKAKRAERLQQAMPNKGDWIQALQTTEQMFGYGISLGPLVGLAQDIIAGTVRVTQGKPVSVKFPVPDFKHWILAAEKVLKAGPLLWGVPHYTDEDEILQWLGATLLAYQAVFDIQDQWNAMDAVENVATAEIQAPLPWHTLTKEVIAEGPLPLGQVAGWPQTGQLWSQIEHLADKTIPVANANLDDFQRRNKHSWRGYVGATCIVEGSHFAVATWAGEEQVTYEYSIPSSMASSMMLAAQRLDPNQPIEKFTDFVAYMEYNAKINHLPTAEEINSFCAGPADIKLQNVTR